MSLTKDDRGTSGHGCARWDVDEFKHIAKLVGNCRTKAERCATIGAFRAACTMLGVALETILLATALVDGSGAMPELTKKREALSLNDLISLAEKRGWLATPDSGDQDLTDRDVHDGLKFIPELRNRVAHPDNDVRERPNRSLTQPLPPAQLLLHAAAQPASR